jgi:hypothetical protein
MTMIIGHTNRGGNIALVLKGIMRMTYQIEQTLGRSDASPSSSGPKIESEKPPVDITQSSEGATEVPNDLRAKIRAMLLETV